MDIHNAAFVLFGAILVLYAINVLAGMVFRSFFVKWHHRMELVSFYDAWPLLITPSGRVSAIVKIGLAHQLAKQGFLGVFYAWKDMNYDVILTAPWNSKLYNRYMNNRWEELCRLNKDYWTKTYPHIPVRKPETWEASDLVARREDDI